MMEVRRERKDDGTLQLTLLGAIDDLADLRPVFEGLPPRVVFDLRAIERINSIGVRNWVQSMKEASAKHEIVVQAVPYPMVMQAICVYRFFGDAEVVSCMAPYFCPECERPENLVVERPDVVGGRIPEKRCSRCGSEMFLDELEHYFRVLQ